MIPFFVNLYQFVRALLHGLKDPEFRALFWLVIILLFSGTFFYHYAESYQWLDALYFSVATLTTTGDNSAPALSAGGKIFTIIYLFVGFGVFFTFLMTIAEHARNRNLPRLLDYFRTRATEEPPTTLPSSEKA